MLRQGDTDVDAVLLFKTPIYELHLKVVLFFFGHVFKDGTDMGQ